MDNVPAEILDRCFKAEEYTIANIHTEKFYLCEQLVGKAEMLRNDEKFEIFYNTSLQVLKDKELEEERDKFIKERIAQYDKLYFEERAKAYEFNGKAIENISKSDNRY